MAKERILVVEDEDDIRELIKYNLLKEGYEVEAAASGEEALQRISSRLPDLVVLDLMLPGVDGLEVCREIRRHSRTQHLPIVMLTAKTEESDVVSGLELGADDYITKPFSPRVMVARLRAVLRRKAEEQADSRVVLTIRELIIDPHRHQVTYKGKLIQLTLTEFRLLHLLARRPGLVLSRDQIVEAIHGDSGLITDRAVDVQIVGLRKKLGAVGKWIETVRGVGYRFKE